MKKYIYRKENYECWLQLEDHKPEDADYVYPNSKFYLASEADALVSRLKWEHDQIEGMQRDIKAKLEGCVAELGKAINEALELVRSAEYARAEMLLTSAARKL